MWWDLFGIWVGRGAVYLGFDWDVVGYGGIGLEFDWGVVGFGWDVIGGGRDGGVLSGCGLRCLGCGGGLGMQGGGWWRLVEVGEEMVGGEVMRVGDARCGGGWWGLLRRWWAHI